MNRTSAFRKRFGLSRAYRQEMKAAKTAKLIRS